MGPHITTVEHGFLLFQGDFWDALCFRYVWWEDSEPTSSLWAVSPYPQTMLCAVKGCFHHIASQWDLGHIPANLLRGVFSNTCIEPSLQPLSEEAFLLHTANVDKEARVCIRVKCFCTSASDIFDIRCGLTWEDLQSRVMPVSTCM